MIPSAAMVSSLDPPEAQQLRRAMVNEQLVPRRITDPEVLRAMGKVPRHLFGNFTSLAEAYSDSAYGINCQQAISQPYMVALMTQALALREGDKVLEVGTGSGYQTAILCELTERVFSMERHPDLARQAEGILKSLGYSAVHLTVGDGSRGLPAEAPFDRILITAASPGYPHPLIQQLSENQGIIVFPIDRGVGNQELLKIVRHGDNQYETIRLGNVRFVPLVVEKPNS